MIELHSCEYSSVNYIACEPKPISGKTYIFHSDSLVLMQLLFLDSNF